MAPLDPFAAANALGVFAFAVVGTLKATDADLDLFGATVLGVMTALGGGMVRDVLVGRVPVALRTTDDVAIALVGVVAGVALARLATGRLRDHPALLVPDAVGLAAFAATGALVGVEAGLSAFGAVVLATLTGVGGGSFSDLLLNRVPVVLREDFYATPAALGGALFWTAVEFGVSSGRATLGCAVVVFVLRVVAIRRGWRLPTI